MEWNTWNILLSVVIFVVTSSCVFFKRKYSYWSKLGIDGPTPVPFLGNMFPMFMKPFQEVILDRQKKYGKIYGIYESTKPALAIADVDVLRNILIKDFNFFINRRTISLGENELIGSFVSVLRDDEWKRVRNILTPTFTSGKMKMMFGIMKSCVDDSLEHLEKVSKSSDAKIELKKFFGSYTVDIIGRCCFATKVDSYNDPNNEFAKNCQQLFRPRLWLFVVLFLLPKKVTKLLNLAAFDRDVQNFFVEATKHLIRERKTFNGSKHNDFLNLMINANANDAQDNYEDNADDHNELHKPVVLNDGAPKLSKGQLSEAEIIAQTMLFFAAGYETTATLLTFAFYELAKSPQLQLDLIQEMNSYEKLDYSAVTSSKLLDSFVSEVLRFYPPAIALEREAESDYVIEYEGRKIPVPKGTIVQVPLYAIHHSDEYYEDSGKFDPHRFLPENRSKIDPMSYLPFGQGNRNCIGMRFALLEAKLIIASLLQEFEFIETQETKIEYTRGTGMLAAKPIFVAIQKRN